MAKQYQPSVPDGFSQVCNVQPMQQAVMADIITCFGACHPSQHRTIITLKAMKNRGCHIPCFTAMKHGTPDAYIVHATAGHEREMS